MLPSKMCHGGMVIACDCRRGCAVALDVALVLIEHGDAFHEDGGRLHARALSDLEMEEGPRTERATILELELLLVRGVQSPLDIGDGPLPVGLTCNEKPDDIGRSARDKAVG